MELKGWVELEGERLSEDKVETILAKNPSLISKFGGEFFIKWDGCMSRDHFGIIPGDCPAGVVICSEKHVMKVDPAYASLNLEQAIKEAVRLRSDEGIVALSGGVDSALVAQLARRPCVAVGIKGSHDLDRARKVANELDLPLETVTIDPMAIEDALRQVLAVIPRVDPVNASIASTLYFVAKWAGDHEYKRILAGQGADELFGGYARYIQTKTLAQDLERDFINLKDQLARDQAAAALHNTYFSLPYMDKRVVSAARAILPENKIRNGVRKIPLREVAEHLLPSSIAQYEKKAMQYGSGVMKEIRKLANHEGYKDSVQDYLTQLVIMDGEGDRTHIP